MNTKDKYHLLCNTETSIPIFSRDWWLDTVCGKDKWKVLLVEEKERITAAMPLYCPRQGIISMPSYTQTMGPWFAPESKDTKYTKTLGHRQVLCKQLLNTLKAIRILCKIFITESPTGYHSIGKVTDKQHATPIC